MWLHPGIELLGASSVKKGIRNNAMYTVESVGETVTLVGGTILTHAQVLAWLRLSYARTYASIG